MWTIARIDDADYGCEERMPEEVEAENPNDINAANQSEWLENYYRALEEMEEISLKNNC